MLGGNEYTYTDYDKTVGSLCFVLLDIRSFGNGALGSSRFFLVYNSSLPLLNNSGIHIICAKAGGVPEP